MTQGGGASFTWHESGMLAGLELEPGADWRWDTDPVVHHDQWCGFGYQRLSQGNAPSTPDPLNTLAFWFPLWVPAAVFGALPAVRLYRRVPALGMRRCTR
jgi:hypothetical protein